MEKGAHTQLPIFKEAQSSQQKFYSKINHFYNDDTPVFIEDYNTTHMRLNHHTTHDLSTIQVIKIHDLTTQHDLRLNITTYKQLNINIRT